MHIRALFFILALSPVAAVCGDNEAIGQVTPSSVEEDLQSFLFSRYDGFQITEVFSKTDNMRAFLRTSLDSMLTETAAGIETRELFFKPVPSGHESHVAVAVLTYPGTEAARKAAGSVAPSGYIKDSKILIRYICANRGDSNLILYTESAADTVVLEFMGKYTKGPEGRTTGEQIAP